MISPINCGSPINAGSQQIQLSELKPLSKFFSNNPPYEGSVNELKAEANHNDQNSNENENHNININNNNNSSNLNVDSLDELFLLEQTEIDKIDDIHQYFKNLSVCLEKLDVREYFKQNADADIPIETVLSKIIKFEVDPYNNIAFQLLPSKLSNCNTETQFIRKSTTSKMLSYTQQLVNYLQGRLVSRTEPKEGKQANHVSKKIARLPRIFQAGFAERSTLRWKITNLQKCTVLLLLIILNGIQLSLLIMQEIQRSNGKEGVLDSTHKVDQGNISLTRIYSTIFFVFNIFSTLLLFVAISLMYVNRGSSNIPPIAVFARLIVITQLILMIVFYSINLDFSNEKFTIQLGKTVLFGILILLLLFEAIFSVIKRYRPDLLLRDFMPTSSASKVLSVQTPKKYYASL